jgi:hypothetical protein
MSAWAVGDLAVKRRGVCDIIPRGTIARVTGLTDAGGLFLDGWPDEMFYRGEHCVGWDELNFDRIKPDTEPCEEEFTVLIKRGRKVSV